LRRVVTRALLAGAILLGGCFVLRLVIVTDTQRIARAIENGRRGMVGRDPDQVMSVVDPTYEDDFGMNYDRLRRWFETQFRTYDSITCVIPILSTHVYRGEAVCSLTVWFAGYSKERRSPAAEGLTLEGFPRYGDRLVLYLDKTETGWRIVGTSR
jgi:hypothetical protein